MDSQSGATECSPFEIPREHADVLCQSQAFQELRRHLANQASFCPHHSGGGEHSQDSWVLHRDILHALIRPVAELYKRASALAEAALCATKPEDLELAFAGDARGAFVWLQCFLGEEPDWCQTRGCPACVTMETLSTESHVRLTIAASLLSTASISSTDSSLAPTCIPLASTGEVSPKPKLAFGLALPALPHILAALRGALDKDAFWGPEYWSYLFARAEQLCAGIKTLIASCVDLESLVSSPTTQPPSMGRSTTMPGLVFSARGKGETKGARLRKSKLAERQLRMKVEEMELMKRGALQYWAKAMVPNTTRSALLMRGERRRSLTCP